MTVQQIIDSVPYLLQYIVPGFIAIFLYCKLTDSHLPTNLLWYSATLSFVYNLISTSPCFCILLAAMSSVGLFFMVRYTPLKKFLKASIGYSPSKSVWEDIVDYKCGTKMFVQTNDRDSFGGWYSGYDTARNCLILANYNVADKDAHILFQSERSIVAIPLSRIQYITIDYPDGSEVADYWFGEKVNN